MSAEMISGFTQIAANTMQAYGSVQQGKEQARVAKTNAQNQAAAQAYNAQQVQAEAVAKENAARRQNRAAVGKQIAAMGQAGVAGSGTALGVLDQSMIEAETDALSIRYSGINRANAMRYDAQNTLLAGRNQAASAKSAGWLGAAGLLAQNAVTAYGLYAGSAGTGKTAVTTQAEKNKPAFNMFSDDWGT